MTSPSVDGSASEYISSVSSKTQTRSDSIPIQSRSPPSFQVSRETVSLKPKPQHDGVMKGIVVAVLPEPRLCELVKPPVVVEDVAPFSMIQSISLQKLTPKYKVGMDPWALGELKAMPPMRASELWTTKPAVVLCIRRPELVIIFLIAL
eukprot:Gb_37174 [translate_table: standard]